MLRFVNVFKSYQTAFGETPVLHNVSMAVEQGEFCALTGPSGSGKTTVMNLAGLLDRPDAGTIEIGGADTSNLEDGAAARLRNLTIGFVFQSFHLLPRLSILDNVALPLLYRGVSRADSRLQAMVALDRVGLSNRVRHRPDEISGGQRQRVAIARAIVGRPSILLADEPTGNLDSRTADEMLSLFSDLNRELNVTTVIVTHDLGIASRCGRQIAMLDGKIVF
nr:ABC transporter ATP-binding protein [Methylosinus sp. C49]